MSQEGLIRVDARTAGRSCQTTGSVQLETQWSVLHVVSQGGFWFMCSFWFMWFAGGERGLSLFPAPARSICAIKLFLVHTTRMQRNNISLHIRLNRWKHWVCWLNVASYTSATSRKSRRTPPQARENNGGSVTDPTPLRLSLKFF